MNMLEQTAYSKLISKSITIISLQRGKKKKKLHMPEVLLMDEFITFNSVAAQPWIC